MGVLTLADLQQDVRVWTQYNFPNRKPHQPLLGIAEEVGELCHAHLKEEQGIRGTPEELQTQAKDAVGDIIVFLADYCNLRDWDMQAILEEVWKRVQRRRWAPREEQP